MRKNRLYLLLTTAILAAYGYLAWALSKHAEHSDFTPCLFKNITGIPCPSCGSTRSVLSLVKGNFFNAILINPLGVIIAVTMLLLPLWLLYDLILKKDTLYINYKLFEKTVQVKWVAVILITLIIANWIWNINKGL